MPKPKKGESKDEFISRCMGYDDMQKYDQKQRAAICYSYWRNKNETLDMDTFTDILLEEKNSKMNKGQVLKALRNAAEDIHGDVKTDLLKGIADKAIQIGKDTEDAIQIGINMLRSE